MTPTSKVVRRAQRLDIEALAPHLPENDKLKDGSEYKISIVTPAKLSKTLRDAVWKLYDDNMKEISQSTSLAYEKRDKLKELFHPQTRFILITSVDDTSSTTTTTTTEELLAFASFRFDVEDTLESLEYEDEPLVDVLYIYEMQVAPSARGSGLGKALLRECQGIAEKTEMEKMMLTCLKANVDALRFYAAQGFQPDEIDPTRLRRLERAEKSGEDVATADIDWTEEVKVEPRHPDDLVTDYRILSLDVVGNTA